MRIAVLISTFAVLMACQPDRSADQSESDSDTTLPFVSVDPSPELEKFVEEHMLRPGIWREHNGSRICYGFMTRIENENYCSANIPAGWVQFEFEGEIYYVQPLADNID